MADLEWRRYLKTVDLTTWESRGGNVATIPAEFEKLCALRHNDYTALVAALLEEHSWLKEFTSYSTDFSQSRGKLERHGEATCQILRDYVKMVSGQLLQANLDESPLFSLSLSHMSERQQQTFERALDESRSFGEFTKRTEAFAYGRERELRDSIRSASEYWIRIQHEDRWPQLCHNIKTFCESTGCTAIPSSPLQSILKLHELTKGSETVKKLRDEIDKLNDDLKRKDEELGKHCRIIACLTFRRVMEQLPEHPNKRWDYTVDWANFWIKAMSAAEENPDHPLRPVIDQFGAKPGYDRIHAVGEEMYGDLSTDIHHFNDGGIYEVREDIWSALQGAILRGLIPKDDDVGKDGTVKWYQWRKWFLARKEESGSDNDDEDEDDEDEDDSDTNEGSQEDDAESDAEVESIGSLEADIARLNVQTMKN